jgi:quinolinate synthase
MRPNRKVEVWLGECHVHKDINPQTLEQARRDHPKAEVLVHPECGCAGQLMYAIGRGDIPAEGVHIASTERMVQLVQERPAEEFIVATETGIMHRMQQTAPEKHFFAADRAAVCAYMKTITLEATRDALKLDQFHVTVPALTAARARAALDRMVALGPAVVRKPGD